MKIIKDYSEFILESILVTSKKFKDIISRIDDPVAISFYKLINTDIDTKYNNIDISSDPDKVSFVLNYKFNDKSTLSNKDNLVKIGKVVNSILKDNGLIYNEKQIENFVNKFKAQCENLKILLVKGDDIRFWYYENNYCTDTRFKNYKLGKGTLGRSCMRYYECQTYFGIYVENPECEMVIALDSENKLRARALLWKTNKGRYLDRIYYTYDSDKEIILNWVNENFGKVDGYDSGGFGHIVKLTGPNNSYDGYPYMDSFIFYHVKNKTLYMGMSSVDDVKELIRLTNDDGEYGEVFYREEDDNFWDDYNNVILNE